MSPQSATAADQLPGALLARILRRVPLQQRVSSYALVCKAWALAAGAATHRVSLVLHLGDAENEGSAADLSSMSIAAGQAQNACLEDSGFTGWLQRHGSNLHSLGLRWMAQGAAQHATTRLQLPCPTLVQLTSLILDSCVVSTTPQQAAASTSAQAVVLPQLMQLKLRSCMSASAASFQQVAGLASLTALELQCVEWDDITDSPQPHAAAAGSGSQPSALAAVLQACSRLCKLRLLYWDPTVGLTQTWSVFMPPSSLASVRGLQQLQHLEVDMPEAAGVTPLPDLATTLTRLELRVPLGSLAVLSALQPLQQLQELSALVPESPAPPAFAPPAVPLPDLPCSLTRLVLGPREPTWMRGAHKLVQRDLSQLRVLELSKVTVHVSVLSSMNHLQQLVIDSGTLEFEAAAVDGPVTALLAVVGKLALLQQLKLVLTVEPEAVLSAAFSALTVSSQLRVLHVELTREVPVPVPGPDVLQHMFPAGRRLAQLHTLVLGSAQQMNSQWVVPPADVARIAASCPALHTVSLVDVLAPGGGDSLCALLHLTSVSSLRVGGPAWDDRAAGVVARLTQLTRLAWSGFTPGRIPTNLPGVGCHAWASGSLQHCSGCSTSASVQMGMWNHLQKLKRR